jgi:hypothetical protein
MNKMKMPWYKKGQWGMAMPMALMILVLASMVVVPSVMAGWSLLKLDSKISQKTQAYFAADAGVADLIWNYKYGTAPTGDYQLSNINGMTVDVKLVKTSGEDYYWEASAQNSKEGNAQVYVQVQHTTAGAENLFKYAVTGLDTVEDSHGHVLDTVALIGHDNNNTCLVTSDDVLIPAIDYCNVSWTRFWLAHSRDISISNNGSINEEDSDDPQYFDLGSRSAMFTIKPDAGAENLAFRNVSMANISDYKYISLWVYSPDRSFAKGDLALIIATAQDVGGTFEYLPLEYIPDGNNGNGTRMNLLISNPANFSSLRSIGIRQARDVITEDTFLYIDEVVATNGYPHGTVYANGDVSLSHTTVNDSVTATGSISKPSNSTIWGGSYPNYADDPFDPTVRSPDEYKNEVVGTPLNIHDIHNSTNLGPGYIVGDLEIHDHAVVTLKGTVYITGKLTISDSAHVTGAYPLVVDTVEITSDYSVKLAQDKIPFIYAYGTYADHINHGHHGHHHEHGHHGNAHDDSTIVLIDPDGNGLVSAVIYAESGQARLSGDARLYGAVVAETVLMEDRATVEYMSRLQATGTWPANNWGITATSPSGTGTTTVKGYDYR